MTSPIATTTLLPNGAPSAWTEEREDHQRGRLRDEDRAGLQRRVAEHRLQVLRQQEDRAEQREEHERDRARSRRRTAGSGRSAGRASGSTTSAPTTKNADEDRAPTTNAATISGDVQPWLGASMIAHSSAPRPTIDRTAPTGSSRGACGSLESGTKKIAEHERGDHDRHVDEEHRAPPEVLQQHAAGDRADSRRRARRRRPTRRWPWRARAGREHVREDRERGRHDARAADAHQRAGADEHGRPTARTPTAPNRCRR